MDANKDETAASATLQQLIPPLSSSSSCSSTSSCSCDDDDGRKEAEVITELTRRRTEEEDESNEEKDRDEAGGISRGGVSDNADVEDGYHTPTSPEHRIPTSSECPRAPRKRSRFQYLSRKSMDGSAERGNSVRREIVFDLSVELDGFMQKNKKTRREAAIAK